MSEVTGRAEVQTKRAFPEGWREKGGRVQVEIGPGDGLFQYHQAVTTKKPGVLNNTALLLIDTKRQIRPEFVKTLNGTFGHVTELTGDGTKILSDQTKIPPHSVDTIDINNVFGAPGMPLDIDQFVAALDTAVAPGGTINIRETNTPNILDRLTSERLLKALNDVFGNADLITDRNHPLFEAFRDTARPESYGIVVQVPEVK